MLIYSANIIKKHSATKSIYHNPKFKQLSHQDSTNLSYLGVHLYGFYALSYYPSKTPQLSPASAAVIALTVQ